jgi:ATP-dependent RNA helicase DeaD
VESLAEEFDLLDIAAAAVKLAHPAIAGPEESREPEPAVDRREARAGRARSSDRESAGVVRLFIGAGREAGIRPGDVVGAIANEAGVRASELGAIEIRDRFSLVEVPAAAADEIVKAMRKATLRGQTVLIRRDREST